MRCPYLQSSVFEKKDIVKESTLYPWKNAPKIHPRSLENDIKRKSAKEGRIEDEENSDLEK